MLWYVMLCYARHDGTYSHEWGASPIVGVAWGVLGVHHSIA
jgi:hypothetical protein